MGVDEYNKKMQQLLGDGKYYECVNSHQMSTLNN